MYNIHETIVLIFLWNISLKDMLNNISKLVIRRKYDLK